MKLLFLINFAGCLERDIPQISYPFKTITLEGQLELTDFRNVDSIINSKISPSTFTGNYDDENIEFVLEIILETTVGST
jgi:hypothetical protein